MACDAKCQAEAAERRRVGAWSTLERKELLARYMAKNAVADDLIEFAMVELYDALDNVDPIDGGSEFNAGCCMMRAIAALHRLQRYVVDIAAVLSKENA
jgi:hypothetical protein